MLKEALASFFQKVEVGDAKIVFWDGDEIKTGNGEAKVKVFFKKPLPLLPSFSDPMLALGDAYCDGYIDIEGDYCELARLIFLNKDLFKADQNNNAKKLLGIVSSFSTKMKQKKDIEHHYDIGDDFYSLWLDETMSYSCAYFKNAEDTLKQAQINKIDHTLKKLQLVPGQRLLDIGSGWGELIIRAAKQYRVKALGVTLSDNQYKETKKRIAELGLAALIDVQLINYLDLDESEYEFDKIVSIGMIEHVGAQNYGKYLAKVNSLLTQGGLSLLHMISNPLEGPTNAWMTKNIFPGGQIPSLREIVHLLPEYDFHLLHLESLRLHYARTLDCWFANFEQHIDEITKKLGERFVRMWGMYLKACAASFRVSGLDLHQLLFSKGLNNDLSLTYDYLYR